MRQKTLLTKVLLITTLFTIGGCGGGGSGGASKGSWTIGSQSYSATTVVDTLETPSLGILQINTGSVFESEISITYTLTGPGTYYVTGVGSVSDDGEDLVYTKRIGILAQRIDPAAELGFSFYTTTTDSGFVDVTVDSAGKYHFDVLSTSPITMLESTGSMNTVDFSMNDIYDFR